MANDGCFLGLKPIAEAIELKLRPLGLGRPCREGFWVEYGLPFPILCNLEGRDHQAREGDSWREGNVEDMRDDLPKRMWEFEMIQVWKERRTTEKRVVGAYRNQLLGSTRQAATGRCYHAVIVKIKGNALKMTTFDDPVASRSDHVL